MKLENKKVSFVDGRLKQGMTAGRDIFENLVLAANRNDAAFLGHGLRNESKKHFDKNRF